MSAHLYQMIKESGHCEERKQRGNLSRLLRFARNDFSHLCFIYVVHCSIVEKMLLSNEEPDCPDILTFSLCNLDQHPVCGLRVDEGNHGPAAALPRLFINEPDSLVLQFLEGLFDVLHPEGNVLKTFSP